MVVGQTGRHGELAPYPVGAVRNGDFVRVQIHQCLEEGPAAQACPCKCNSATKTHVLVCLLLL